MFAGNVDMELTQNPLIKKLYAKKYPHLQSFSVPITCFICGVSAWEILVDASVISMRITIQLLEELLEKGVCNSCSNTWTVTQDGRQISMGPMYPTGKEE